MYQFDRRKFQAQMVLHGKTGADVAKIIGKTESTLYNKLRNNGDFTREEMGKLIDALDITDINGIFFAENVADMQ